MPCPEKFRETLVQYNVPQEIICQINQGFEDMVSRRSKKKKVLYFKSNVNNLVVVRHQCEYMAMNQ